MTDDGTHGDDADERVVEFLGTADRPRQLASEVATALDLARGRVRTRLQALSDEGRVVRVDAAGTARWAVPDRADEPEPADEAADDAPSPDPGTDPGEPEPGSGATDGSDAASGGGPEQDGDPERGDGEGPVTEPTVDRSPNAEDPDTVPDPDPAPDEAAEGDDATDAGAGLGDGYGGGRAQGRWRPGPAGVLAVLIGLALALAALGRLRRR